MYILKPLESVNGKYRTLYVRGFARIFNLHCTLTQMIAPPPPSPGHHGSPVLHIIMHPLPLIKNTFDQPYKRNLRTK